MTTSIERFPEDNEIAINYNFVIDNEHVSFNMVISEYAFEQVISFIREKHKADDCKRIYDKDNKTLHYEITYIGGYGHSSWGRHYQLDRIYRNERIDDIPIESSILDLI